MTRKLAPDAITNTALVKRADGRPPVVLQVLPALVTGGVERTAVDVANAVAAAGWTGLAASSGGPLARELVGAAQLDLPLQSKNPLVMAANIGRLARLIGEHRVDILHARSRAPAWSAWAAARRTGCHFVTTFHGTYNFGNPVKRGYNAIMTRGERVIANSRYIAEHIQANYQMDPAVIRVIPRGIDTTRFDPESVSPERIAGLAKAWNLSGDAPVIMLPGRLTRWKGQLLLIAALAGLRRRPLHCLLVGDDQGREGYRREIETAIARHGLGEVVRIAEHCDDMPAAYMLADLVVSASTDPEAFGRVAVEAQAMGRPLVASKHGGAAETVLDGETGWLARPGDAPALAEAIEQALNMSREDRAGMARRAMAHARSEYRRDVMCERTLAVYGELLSAGRGER